MSNLIVLFRERAQTLAFLASSFLAILGSYPCDVLKLVFLLMTSFRSLKMDFVCATCCVFEFGVFPVLSVEMFHL
jgi:hypothetical protein